jgi:hypothetical protein
VAVDSGGTGADSPHANASLSRTRVARDRPLSAVPRAIWCVLLTSILFQAMFHASSHGSTRAIAQPLPQPSDVEWVRLVTLGDGVAASRLLMLWLQAFDNQPGISLPLASLDYDRVIGWLSLALDLDPDSTYPMLAATRIYAQVSDEDKARSMLAFVHKKFLQSPNERWRWLADATITAKHRLKDLALAQRFARDLRQHATGPDVPFWARDMQVIVLTEMGEFETAQGIIGGLLESGQITDPAELRFLTGKLEEIRKLVGTD